jgi:hypothetical protein
MKEILITSLNETGDAALEKHLSEFKKLPLRQRLIFKAAGYKQELLNEKPYTILLSVNNRQASNPMFLDLITTEIETALNLNGAQRDNDFKIEVKNNE